MGFPAVRLVGPEMDPAEAEARWLAHGAEEVLTAVTVHDHLADALSDCSRAVATTARPRNWRRPVRTPAEAATLLAEATPQAPLAIVLGPEDRGLTNEDLAHCDEILSIPLPPHRSATLSLPAAATIVAWELARAGERLAERPVAHGDLGERAARPLDHDSLEDLLQAIHATLDELGFRPRPDEVRFRGSLRDFVSRARPTQGDRALLRHLFAQVGKWQRRVQGELARKGDA
jgi:tRNA/rRNA methyltransferase